MKRIEVDVVSGEVREIDLTPEEIAALPIPEIETEPQARERAIIDIRTERKPILDALTGIGFGALIVNDAATIDAVSTARQSALDITVLPAFLAATTYDEMKAAIMAEWRRMAVVAPINVQTAFREILG